MKIGLIGCGGMGTTHNIAIKTLSENDDIEIVALADIREEFLKKAATLWPQAKTFKTGIELIENSNIDIVHICVPTYLHAEHAILAMEKGINVFIEKPVCLKEEDCEKLIQTQQKTGTTVMVGHVIRFFDEYNYLKEVYDKKTYGNLKSITMKRLSGDVTWGFEDWFHDSQKSGSVVLDLHIHDVDFLRYMIGEPQKVMVNSTSLPSGMVNHIISQYQFGNINASVEGLWDISPALPFEASFNAHFDKATVAFNSKMENPIVVYLDDGKTFTPTFDKEFEKDDNSAGINISNIGPYYTEIKYFISCIKNGQQPDIAPLLEGIKSVRLASFEHKLAKNATKDWVDYK